MNSNDNIRSFRDEVLKDAKKLGGEAALGGDALPKLALRVLKAADDGIITTDKDSTTGKDDVDRIYEEYLEGYGKKAIYENTEQGKKANASKLRQVARLGIERGSKYDPIEAVDTMKNMREEAKAKDVKVKAMYPCIVDLARSQLKLDRQITREEIEEIITKREAEVKPVDEVLGKIRETLEKIVTGEHKSGMCQDPRVVAAHDSLRDYLAGIEAAAEEEKNQQLLAAYLEKRGLKLVPSAEDMTEAVESVAA